MSQSDTDRLEPPDPIEMSDKEIIDWIEKNVSQIWCDSISGKWIIDFKDELDEPSIRSPTFRDSVRWGAATLQQKEDHDERL